MSRDKSGQFDPFLPNRKFNRFPITISAPASSKPIGRLRNGHEISEYPDVIVTWPRHCYLLHTEPGTKTLPGVMNFVAFTLFSFDFFNCRIAYFSAILLLAPITLLGLPYPWKP
jgi:hypothetical protein